MRYLRIYTGYTSGTLGGRDDGFPITEYAEISKEKAGKLIDEGKEDEVFKIMPLTEKQRESLSENYKKNKKDKEEAERKAEIAELESKLKKLKEEDNNEE